MNAIGLSKLNGTIAAKRLHPLNCYLAAVIPVVGNQVDDA